MHNRIMIIIIMRISPRAKDTSVLLILCTAAHIYTYSLATRAAPRYSGGASRKLVAN